MHPLHSAALYCLALATLAPSGTSAQLDPASRVLLQTEFPSHETLHQATGDDGLWVRGRTYKAHAEGPRFTYIPFLGSKASQNWPITFELVAARTGASPLATSAQSTSFDGADAVLRQGDVETRYHLGLEHVEQTFRVDPSLVRSGDLVFEVAVTTDLEVEQQGDVLMFRGPDGAVRFGSATVLDEGGRSEAVATRWNGEQLTFRVPAAFAAAAEGAIVLDPVITTVTVDSFSLELSRPDVAYDADTNRFCVVYEEEFSATDGDIYSRVLNGSTLGLVSGSYLDASDLRAYRPRIATIAATDRFVVVYMLDDIFGLPDIHMRTRTANDGATWDPSIALLEYSEFFTYENPDIGGEAYEGTGETRAVMVCEEVGRGAGSFSSGIRGVPIDRDGVPEPVFLTIEPSLGPLSLSKPAISRFTGDPQTHGVWNIAYLAGPADQPATRLRRAQMRYDLTMTEQGVDVTGGGEFRDVDVSAPYEGMLGESFHILSDMEVAGDDRVGIISRHEALPAGTTDFLQYASFVEISDNTPRQIGGLATVGDRALMTNFDLSATTNRYELKSSTLERVRPQQVGVGERRIHLGELNQLDAQHAASVSKTSGGTAATSNEVFVVWEDSETATSDGNIYAALVNLPNPTVAMGTYCRGRKNSTGNYGFLAAYGNGNAVDPKLLIATDLPLGTLGYFLAAPMFDYVAVPNTEGILCLGGGIGRYAGDVLNSGPGGRFVFSMDPTSIPSPTGSISAMAGLAYHFQAWHRDTSLAGPTSNFTSAVRVIF